MLSGNDKWPDSLQALYEQVAGASPEAVLASRPQWSEQLAQWVRGATLDERETAQVAAWSRLDSGTRSPGELLFLLAHCGELLWPYSEPPPELLQRLTSRQGSSSRRSRVKGRARPSSPSCARWTPSCPRSSSATSSATPRGWWSSC